MIIPLFFALHTDPRFLQKVVWHKSTNHWVLGKRNILWLSEYLLYYLRFRFSIYFCLIMTHSIETAPKKIKSYLYLIYIKPKKKNTNIAFTITSLPSLCIVYTYTLKSSCPPQKRETVAEPQELQQRALLQPSLHFLDDSAITTFFSCISLRLLWKKRKG